MFTEEAGGILVHGHLGKGSHAQFGELVVLRLVSLDRCDFGTADPRHLHHVDTHSATGADDHGSISSAHANPGSAHVDRGSHGVRNNRRVHWVYLVWDRYGVQFRKRRERGIACIAM